VTLVPAEIIPVPLAGSEAPRDARPVTIIRPSEADGKQERSIGSLSPLHSYVIEQDPTLWLVDGLAAGLNNAGYRIEFADRAKAAKTSIIIRVDTAALSLQNIESFQPLLMLVPYANPFSTQPSLILTCVLKISNANQDIYWRDYRAQELSTNDESNSARKVLETLLSQAVPELVKTLVPLTQPGAASAGQR
jgi:hypothetical protein